MQPEKQASSKGSTVGLALLFGVGALSLSTSFNGFVIGALIGALLAQVFHLRSRTNSLEQQLRAIAQSLKAGAAPEKPVERTTAPVAEPIAKAPAPEPVAAQIDEAAVRERAAAEQARRQAAAEQAAAARARAITAQAAKPAVPAPPSPIDQAIESFMGWLKRGNPLARIGIVILFFGAAFLAKYAADNSLLPIELRFMAIAIGAFALLIVGWRLREKREVYAQLLQGGGIAGLYLTVFAATKLYDLLPLTLAFGLMVVIALAAAILAVGQNALSLAVIGTAGGFLAPILVSTGSGNHIALFAYYAVLNLGVFAVAWFRTWKVLNVLGFVFTFTITGLWRVSGYEANDLFSADAFLILFFLMYVGVSILKCVRQPPDLKGYVSGSLVFGLPIVAFALHASMVSRIEYAMAWSALAVGVFYLLLGIALYRTGRESFRLLVEAFAALGVIFGSLAIPLAFDTRTTAAMWAVEGAGLLWLGVRQERKLARAFGALLQVAAGFGYLIGLRGYYEAQPILNSTYLGSVMLSLSGICTGYWLYRNRERQAGYEASADVVFTLWAVAWWLFGGIGEINRFADTTAYGAVLGFVALTVGLLAALAVKRDWRFPLLIATYLPVIFTVLSLVLLLDKFGHPFAQWGALGWLLLFGAQFAILKLGETREVSGLDWFHATASWALTLIIAWEASWQIGNVTTGVWAQLPWGVVPALIVAWLSRQQLLPRWPAAAHEHAYRIYACAPLVIGVALWILGINLTSTGDATWLPYLPLLNPLDVSVALCFASLAMWWISLSDAQRGQWQVDLRALLAVVAGLVFLWLNAALIRSLHHNFGAPITPYGLSHSTLVQASLSIFWGILGFTAMTLAARQRWRYVWMVGCALMIVVVIKLLAVDLSKIGTIARITSFLTVGALLLVTGYLAPLPPRKASEEAAA